MNQEKKVQFILKTLNHLYPNPPIPLKHKSPYTLLIAVLLSARCTDARVNLATPTLFSLADTPEKMMGISVEKICFIIRSCGLSPQKSKAISLLSKILVEKYESKVPSTFEALESLPGIGHKSASVVMTQVFNKPAFPVDTHIHRLALRWGLSNAKGVQKIEKDLKSLFPKKSWIKLHLQMIYYGREYSPARGFDVSKSPICKRIMSVSN